MRIGLAQRGVPIKILSMNKAMCFDYELARVETTSMVAYPNGNELIACIVKPKDGLAFRIDGLRGVFDTLADIAREAYDIWLREAILDPSYKEMIDDATSALEEAVRLANKHSDGRAKLFVDEIDNLRKLI